MRQSRPVPRTQRLSEPGNDGELTAAQIAALTTSVDIDAPPPDTGPSALVLFGTNQAARPRSLLTGTIAASHC